MLASVGGCALGAGSGGEETESRSLESSFLEPSQCLPNVGEPEVLPSTAPHLCAADFDGDGWEDLITTPLSGGRMAVQLQRNETFGADEPDWSDPESRRAPLFTAGALLTAYRDISQERAVVSCGDFDGDGDADVVYVSCAAPAGDLEGDDLLEGSPTEDDVLRGCGGDDVLRGVPGRDPGDDEATADCLYGDRGADRIGGKGGDDELFGGPDDDELWGDAGDDLLVGGAGLDRLHGQDGADTFVLVAGRGVDTITDFDAGEGDLLRLLGGVGFGELTIDASASGATAVRLGAETLALLEGVAPAALGADAFYTCPGDARCGRRCPAVADLPVCGGTAGGQNCMVSRVELIAGRGDSTFDDPVDAFAGLPPSLGALGWSGGNEIATDYDGDGDVDLLLGVADEGGGSVQLLLNEGGSFTRGEPVVTDLGMGQRGAVAMAWADFTGDGAPDLAVSGPSTTEIRLYDALPETTFQTVNASGAGGTYPGGASALLAVDFRLDGSLDLAVASDGLNVAGDQGGTIYLFESDGSPTPFSGGLSEILLERGAATDFDGAVAIDYDQDPLGTADLILADGNTSGELYVVPNRPVASAAPDTGAVDCSPEEPMPTPPVCDPSPVFSETFDGCGGNQNNTVPPGWTLESGAVDWWLNAGLDGCAVDLAGSSGMGVLTREIATEPGQAYLLTLRARSNDGNGTDPGPRPFRMSAAGASADFESSVTPAEFTLSFTATGSTTELRLESLIGGSRGAFVDDVVVRRDCGALCEPGPNLIVNGDFEEACAGDSFNPGEIPGWEREGTHRHAGFPWIVAPQDRCVIDLSGPVGDVGSITQEVPTEPGVLYRLEWDVGTNDNGGPAAKTYEVLVGDAARAFAITSAEVPLRESVEFVAEGPTTLVRFQDIEGTGYGALIDNVDLRRVCGGCSPGPELVTNGDFEALCEGALDNPGEIPGWEVLIPVNRHGTYDFISSPLSGCAMDLNGPSAGEIATTVATIPGERYTLRFDLGANDDGPPELKTFTVTVGGEPTPRQIAVSDAPLAAGVELEFVAVETETTVSFASTTLGAFGPVIDNVSIRQSCAVDGCLRGRDLFLLIDVDDFGVVPDTGDDTLDQARLFEASRALLDHVPAATTVRIVGFGESPGGASEAGYRVLPAQSRDAARETLSRGLEAFPSFVGFGAVPGGYSGADLSAVVGEVMPLLDDALEPIVVLVSPGGVRPEYGADRDAELTDTEYSEHLRLRAHPSEPSLVHLDVARGFEEDNGFGGWGEFPTGYRDGIWGVLEWATWSNPSGWERNPDPDYFCACGADDRVGAGPVDIVLAIDTSGSMTQEEALIREQMQAFLRRLESDGQDVRLILLSGSDFCFEGPLGTDGACAGGRPVDRSGGLWSDTRAPDYAHLDRSISSTNALASVLAAAPEIAPWLRPEARKHLLVISDDRSGLAAEEFLAEQPAQLPGLTGFRFGGLVVRSDCPAAAGSGAEYVELARRTGGAVADFCAADPDDFFEGIFGALVCEGSAPCVPGPDELSNGGFDGCEEAAPGASPTGWMTTGETQWSASASLPGGGCALRLEGGAEGATLRQAVALVPGREYVLRLRLRNVNDAPTLSYSLILDEGFPRGSYDGGYLQKGFDRRRLVAADGPREERYDFVAGAASAELLLEVPAGGELLVDDFSLRERCPERVDGTCVTVEQVVTLENDATGLTSLGPLETPDLVAPPGQTVVGRVSGITQLDPPPNLGVNCSDTTDYFEIGDVRSPSPPCEWLGSFYAGPDPSAAPPELRFDNGSPGPAGDIRIDTRWCIRSSATPSCELVTQPLILDAADCGTQLLGDLDLPTELAPFPGEEVTARLVDFRRTDASGLCLDATDRVRFDGQLVDDIASCGDKDQVLYEGVGLRRLDAGFYNDACAGETGEIPLQVSVEWCLGDATGAPPCATVPILEEGFEGCGTNRVNTTPDDWALASGAVDWYLTGHDLAGCAVDLAGTPGAGAIERAIATVPGFEYVLSLRAQANLEGGAVARPFRVSAAGASADFDAPTTPASFELAFTATSASTTLRLESLVGGSFGAWVDDLIVRPACGDDGGTPPPSPPAPEPPAPPPSAGLACTSPADCAPDAPLCFNIPLSAGGRCNECQVDADCVAAPYGGCTYPNPYEAAGAYCSTGTYGEGCETDAACAPSAPHCAMSLQMGTLWLRNCSQCATDADCPAAAPLCETDVFVDTHLRAGKRCVAAGSLPSGAWCERDAACASGSCTEDPLFGVFRSATCD